MEGNKNSQAWTTTKNEMVTWAKNAEELQFRLLRPHKGKPCPTKWTMVSLFLSCQMYLQFNWSHFLSLYLFVKWTFNLYVFSYVFSNNLLSYHKWKPIVSNSNRKKTEMWQNKRNMAYPVINMFNIQHKYAIPTVKAHTHRPTFGESALESADFEL